MFSSDPYILAVSGKGGVGKTTFTALMVKSLLRHYSKKLLVIDADPAANLAAILGLPPAPTIGELITRTNKDLAKKPPNYNASALLEFRLWDEALIEGSTFDFLAAGHTTGPGCYCPINSVLSHMLDNMKSYYDLIILDMDAGLEHISRNTTRTINHFLLLTDGSCMGFQTIQRIIELTRELRHKIKKFSLIGNMIIDVPSQEQVEALANRLSLPCLGLIPTDESIASMNLRGDSLLNLSLNSAAFQKVDSIILNLIWADQF
ncbi:MAG: hypothetical protein EU536_03150 [Promethearchaeota archaeon]|nr:MAG: hypothetical protein EU536_03150 [Candidatus Lokiarchaeota archaeon]